MSSSRGVRRKLHIVQGKTFRLTFSGLGTKPFIYKAITAITRAAPVRITATGHGLISGWPVAVVSVKGMREINADKPLRECDFHIATVIDANTIELNAVNSSDFGAYTSGGYLQFFTAIDLTGAQAAMTIRNRVGGTALVELSSATTGGTVDAVAKTITFEIDADTAAAYTWKAGVHESELKLADETVRALAYGSVEVDPEVVT